MATVPAANGSGSSLERLDSPGGHDAAGRSHRLRGDDLRVGEGSGERASACGKRPREARGADGASRPELAGLVAEFMVREQSGEELPQ